MKRIKEKKYYKINLNLFRIRLSILKSCNGTLWGVKLGYINIFGNQKDCLSVSLMRTDCGVSDT